MLDRAVEHHIFEAERASERAIIGLERRRETPQDRREGGFAGRDEAVVIADAQRIVSVGRFPSAHHGEILPRPAHAHDLHARIFAVALPLGDLAAEQVERLGVLLGGRVEHGIGGGGFGVQIRGDVPVQQLADRDHRQGDRRNRTQPRARGENENDGREDQDIACFQHRHDGGASLLHVARHQERPDADAGDAAEKRQRAPKRNPRHALADEIRKQMPAQQRESRDEDEAGVDRAAEQIDARDPLIGEGKGRRVAPEHIKQRRDHHAGHQKPPAPRTTRRRQFRTRASARPAPCRRTDS